ncbi:MAG: xanthine dehydrogenase [Ruminococcaceae bacterium]|nr:xanthine dehydrogenase [Oscillospiraceae bacterium]
MRSYYKLYQAVAKELDCGHKVVILTRLCYQSNSPDASNKTIVTEAEIKKAADAADSSFRLAQSALQDGKLNYEEDGQGNYLIAEPYFPESRLIILGGGHIAKPLAEFSAKCGFSVTVVDDRPSFANKQRFPLADKVLCESFDSCFPLLNINRSTFIVIITRGHRHDLDCLRQALHFETAYTGMIGSRRRVRAAIAQLSDEGFSDEKLNLVRAPIGLDIGAQTPEEISVSILSELIQFKRKCADRNWPELDRAVLSELSEERQEPRALATIIQTKGSVPRNIGAKMVVWPFGKTLGSIGGGCSESSVMQVAYDVIQSGRCKLVDIDMTGEVAEEEGMVCGGTMKVIVEPYD